MKFIVGDSHVSFFEQAGIMLAHWMGPTHTATIYQLLKLGLDLHHLQEALAVSDHYVNVGVPIWQCPSGVYDIQNIQPGDTVFFSYGFNDIQKNIYLHAKDKSEAEIHRLMSDYIKLLNEYEIKYQVKCIPCSIPPNPAPKINDKGGQHNYGIGGEFHAEGSIAERHAYTQYANKILKELCTQNELQFLDIYEGLSDSDGFIKKEYTTDYVHLTNTNLDLVEILRNIITKI